MVQYCTPTGLVVGTVLVVSSDMGDVQTPRTDAYCSVEYCVFVWFVDDSTITGLIPDSPIQIDLGC